MDDFFILMLTQNDSVRHSSSFLCFTEHKNTKSQKTEPKRNELKSKPHRFQFIWSKLVSFQFRSVALYGLYVTQ